MQLRRRRRSVQAARGACPLPTTVGTRGGKASDVVVSNAASPSVAARPTLPRETADRKDDNEDDNHHKR